MYPACQEGDREFSTDGVGERRCSTIRGSSDNGCSDYDIPYNS